MNREFSTGGTFHLGNFNYEELEVTIAYNQRDPEECSVVSASIVKKIAEGHGNDAYAWFHASDYVIDIINNNNGGLITELSMQDSAERAAKEF
uniref:Uncharacterized protein n=1 Tax=viral metagenome TaxID=1070528 RepID=A0A6H2A1S6_9ZZZZ